MPKSPGNKNINRIIDANINRAKEGLRVCEEITRFILNSRSLTEELKRLRHALDRALSLMPSLPKLIRERNSPKDVGRNIFANELKRSNYQDIFFANIQRAKESVRVLEEFAKLSNKDTAIKFKNMRYRIYEIEKKIIKRI